MSNNELCELYISFFFLKKAKTILLVKIQEICRESHHLSFSFQFSFQFELFRKQKKLW